MKFIITALLVLTTLSFAAETEIYYLDNGMQIALIENHAQPVIASSIVIHSGLRDEPRDMYGVSHLLEHLLFNGTTKRTQEELYEQMDMLGGYNNAHTGENFTNYIILMDKDNFEKGLEIQLDMLFNSTIPNNKFIKEKGIVTEEIGQSHDRASYLADIHFAKRFYRGTPYQSQVLGSRASIEGIKRDRVVKFYRARYVPNNMSAIITGDFNPKEMKELLEKHLGSKTPGLLVERELFDLDLPVEPGIAPLSVHHEKSGEILLRVGLPAPHMMGQDYFTAVIFTELMNQYLKETLTGKPDSPAQHAGMSYSPDRDFGSFVLNATVKSEDDIDKVVEAFRNAFKDLSKKNIKASEIKNIITADKVQSLLYSERPHFYAMMKANLMAFHGYEFVKTYYDNMNKVQVQDVKSLAGKLYDNAPFVPVAVVPYEGEAAPSAMGGGMMGGMMGMGMPPGMPAGGMSDMKTPAEKEEDKPKEKKKPEIVRNKISNGLEIIIAPGSGSGVFAAHFLLKNRSASEPEGLAGITNFLHKMLKKGTTKLDEKALDSKISELGMTLEVADNPWIPFDDYRTTPEFSFIRMETADEFWKDALTLTADVIKNPALKEEDIESMKGDMTASLGRDAASASARSKALFMEKLLGPHVSAKSVNGDLESISAITRANLIERHASYMSPYNMILTIVSDIPAKDVADEVVRLFGGDAKIGNISISSGAATSSPGVYKEEMGKTQSYIRIGYLIDEIPEEDKAPLRIAASILSDKMSFQLRERQGLAYSMGASVDIREGWGYLYSYIGTGPENIDLALEGMKEQINLAAEGRYTDKEVTTAVNSYLGRRNMRLLTSINRASFMGIYAMKDEPLDYDTTWTAQVKDVTAEDVNRCAEKYFHTGDDLVVVVVE